MQGEKGGSITCGNRSSDFVRSSLRGNGTGLLDVNFKSEVVVRAPFAAAEHFPRLFERFEAERGALGLATYGVSVTSLEEVRSAPGRQSSEVWRRRPLAGRGRYSLQDCATLVRSSVD